MRHLIWLKKFIHQIRMKNYAFIIGAQRCGTTYLVKKMQEHPDITVAEPIFPEPKFYLKGENQEKGPEEYYQTLFHNIISKLYVEKSTSYMENPKVAECISRHFPEASIIVMLRNPIHRAISNYFFSKKNGLENLDLEDAFAAEEERLVNKAWKDISVSPYAYKLRGHYINYLKIWSHFFKQNNIHIIFFEELISSKQNINDLFQKLGLSKTKLKFSNQPLNQGDYPSGFKVPDKLFKNLQNEFFPTVNELDHEFGTNASFLWGFN
jgi:hypothetical protein